MPGLPLPSGSRLGTYEIVAPIGAGGMGEVYRARDTKLKRDVAIKTLPDSLSRDAEALARFEGEALAVAALSHPGILSIFDFGTHYGSAYAVMELLEGETLRERLRHGPLPTRKAVELGQQIADALAAAHEKGIVHRDLKPENLFVTKEERVKILDFGLAKQRTAPKDDVTSAPTERPATEPGTVMGTVGYMSPEQVRGHAADARSDIFSFGAVLYEMLSGARAFKGDSAVETMNAILTRDPPELTAASLALPPPLERLVQHCLEKKPERRFQSARDLAFDLETLASASSPSRPHAPAVASARRRSLAIPALGAAMLAGGILLGRTVLKPSVPLPSFRQLTFRLGSVFSARFAPDGTTIAYSAAWDGNPVETFSVRVDSPESRPLGVPSTQVLSVSSKGEMALLVGARLLQHVQFTGTLSRAPLGGGAPREIHENVVEADWNADGSQLAVVRDAGGTQRLELPPGKTLYETTGWISHPRVSPRGDRVAFLDHPTPFDDRGSVVVVDPKGARETLSKGWEALEGLAWSPSGREVWFSGAKSGTAFAIYAATLSGELRTIQRAAGGVMLLDLGKNGQALVVQGANRHWVLGRTRGETKERNLAWLDNSEPEDLSADGSTLLFSEFSEAMGPNYAVCIRKMDGSPAVRLGEGQAVALSPDGRRALSVHPDTGQLELLPTGAGEVRKIDAAGVASSMSGGFLPDGKRIVFFGAETGRPPRLYLLDLGGGKPRAFTPDGTRPSLGHGVAPISPDGKLVAARAADGTDFLFPVDGGDARAIPGLLPGDRIVRFNADGTALYVCAKGELPARLFTVDLATGRREPWKELGPEDRAGALQVYGICLTADGTSYAYGASRQTSDLFVVDGLK
jgi:serine/threonine protein kinase/Tol biopolymer transport system component